ETYVHGIDLGRCHHVPVVEKDLDAAELRCVFARARTVNIRDRRHLSVLGRLQIAWDVLTGDVAGADDADRDLSVLAHIPRCGMLHQASITCSGAMSRSRSRLFGVAAFDARAD